MSSTPLAPSSPPSERIDEIIRLLHLEYPNACCELNHETPFELLVATILSAQCTDVRVNQVTPELFAKYPSPVDFAAADRTELEEAVRSTGFYRNKAKNIQEACTRIVHEYQGEVPANMEDLLTLAGVARKTANVVLGTAYGIADGIVVDTHVKRLSNLLGLTSNQDPKKIERDLLAIVPQSEWIDFSHLLIFHGRRVCIARRPACGDCVLNHLCPSAST
jgi:endonuclease-3